MGNAGDALGDVLRATTLLACWNGASQRHFRARDRNFDIRRINAPVVREAIVHILADAISRPNIIAGTAATLILLPGA